LDVTSELGHIRRALEAHRKALEELETSFLELEDALDKQGAAKRPNKQEGSSSELLSVLQVCQELAMGKSWVHQRIKSREIPSVRLGRNIKVKREDLDKYLEDHRQGPQGENNYDGL
jgi:excisionase family DNA binding protein